jgi:hypothetical protein
MCHLKVTAVYSSTCEDVLFRFWQKVRLPWLVADMDRLFTKLPPPLLLLPLLLLLHVLQLCRWCGQ